MKAMQTLTTAETQEPQAATSSAPLNSTAPLTEIAEEEVEDSAAADTPASRQPLRFDPEPTQRMVVVRRRRRRRSKKASRTEKLLGQLRIALLVIIVGALAAKIAGLEHLKVYLGRFRAILHPLKSRLHTPDIAVIVLVLVALGLLYTMPGIQSRINRLLGIGRRRA